eukprot:CAMPEP_0172385334 /NCGR_PEP_ID=MMETSP1061-20121228/3007_1 /TAXON_ID=37318 /ORGANISM="Pseudo-nitzschia pungens, Strain cf. pungens" /LENGTH=275 /DNA_ID=CAMNT_0013114303 /DNA_START=52 /DNA_END=879 /DNA_ORIENTATION=-
MRLLLLTLIATATSTLSGAFVVQPPSGSVALALAVSSSSSSSGATSTWTNLVPDDDSAPVRKKVVEDSSESAARIPQPGETVSIEYVGRLVLNNNNNNNNENDDDDSLCDGIGIGSWTTPGVLECWLKEQQGLYDVLGPALEERSIDSRALLDLTEDGLEGMDVLSNKIQRKKTIMAIRRLKTTLSEFREGATFDASGDRGDGVYRFVLGRGKTIRAMELGVASMAVGERSTLVCRADYGYGSEGYRKSGGDVVVPPFCGLEFDVKLVGIEDDQE